MRGQDTGATGVTGVRGQGDSVQRPGGEVCNTSEGDCFIPLIELENDRHRQTDGQTD